MLAHGEANEWREFFSVDLVVPDEESLEPELVHGSTEFVRRCEVDLVWLAGDLSELGPPIGEGTDLDVGLL
ncbi:MAG: hypothetical protein AAGA37_13865 [Actinomycetota bacterium]